MRPKTIRSIEDYALFKFKHPIVTSDFSRILAQRVDEYFENGSLSKHANPKMIFKTILGLGAWIGTYLWLLTGQFSPLGVIGLYVLHGLAQLYMSLNIAHDANHGAYSRNRRVNRALGFVFDLAGVSSYVWRLMHNDSHHAFVNVRGADTSLVSGGILRFSPHYQRHAFHRYQHLYAPVIYSLHTLDWVLAKDYRWLISGRRYGNRKIVTHPVKELVALFFGKAFYYTYMLALPLRYLSVPWYSVLAGFLVMHAILGFSLALIFQSNHYVEDSAYPETDELCCIPKIYAHHILETTADYARRNRLLTWAVGALNLHVSHHLFPGICHVHYPPLTEIVKSTAEEHGFKYREMETILGAFAAHLRWLKMLGRTDFDLQLHIRTRAAV